MLTKTVSSFLRVGVLGVVGMLTLSGVTLAQSAGSSPLPGPLCALASVQGPYAYSRSGTVVEKGPTAANGVAIFDGRGHLVGSDTASVNGVISSRDFKGDYTVEAGCIGAATLAFADGEVINLDLQLVAGGRELRFIQTDDGTVITGSATRMTPPLVAAGEGTGDAPATAAGARQPGLSQGTTCGDELYNAYYQCSVDPFGLRCDTALKRVIAICNL